MKSNVSLSPGKSWTIDDFLRSLEIRPPSWITFKSCSQVRKMLKFKELKLLGLVICQSTKTRLVDNDKTEMMLTTLNRGKRRMSGGKWKLDSIGWRWARCEFKEFDVTQLIGLVINEKTWLLIAKNEEHCVCMCLWGRETVVREVVAWPCDLEG